MSRSCVQWRGEIGAYIVGALDGCARDRVARHLATCPGCRADYDELVPVRDWLGLLPLTTDWPAAGHDDQPGSTRFPAQPAIKPRSVRHQRRRWLLAAGAALAAAATAVVVLVSSGASAPTFRAADISTGVNGRAQLHGIPTGTQIDLTATGLPRNERCILVAVAHRSSDIAGSWQATYGGSARIAGTTAIPADQLTALRIESDTGVLLLSIRV